MRTTDLLTIGDTAARSGVATSALRFYEAEGLIASTRTPSGHRRYPRTVLRQIAFIRAAQLVGLSLDEIRGALDLLPHGRTPTKADWEKVSRSWQARLDRQIEALIQLRSALTSCIGCGCLSLKTCVLSNPVDEVARDGAGPRFLKITAMLAPDRGDSNGDAGPSGDRGG